MNDEMSSPVMGGAAKEDLTDFQPRISVVIPAFNEETRIGNTLSEWKRFLAEHYLGSHEILVVMDGCTDRTANVVSRIAHDSGGLIVPFSYPRKLGKGGALIEAFKGSKGEVLFFTDADGSMPAPELLKFVGAIGDNDLVVGCRYFEKSDFTGHLPLSRLVFSRAFNALLKIIFPQLKSLHDTQCGAKAVQRGALHGIESDLFVTDFAFDVNLIYSALRRRLSVKEIRIKYNHFENESKVSHKLLKTSFAMFLSIIRLRLYYSRFRPLMSSRRLTLLIGLLLRSCYESTLV